MAPLPRLQWADGSAYINHVELVWQARGAEVPEFLQRPADVPGRQRRLLGPTDDIVAPSEDFGIDFEAEVAVVTADVPMGSTPEAALEGIRRDAGQRRFPCATSSRPSWPRASASSRASRPPPSARWPAP